MKYSLDWVKEKFDKGDSLKFIFFWGHTQNIEEVGKFVFSQWFNAPFEKDGIEYKTAEHWMMACKALLFKDLEVFERIVKATKPAEVKDLGRRIKNFEESTWNANKYEIVKKGNIYKFQQNKQLGDYLRQTGDRIIVEASPVDAIWGIGLAADSNQIENPHTWRGENLLGFALMETRDYLLEIQK
ncbi:MAG: NADAR family protein [Bacteroidetes bacterium]|nr:NADAR family protein [Bacteroidota bacterium]